MNAKFSVFIICAEAIIYFLIYNLHDCAFKGCTMYSLNYLLPEMSIEPSELISNFVSFTFYHSGILISLKIRA